MALCNLFAQLDLFSYFFKKLSMPVNRSALIRYRTIDKCLQNRRRKWTITDLIDACNEALYEFEGRMQPVSLRTIRLDLNAMRSDKLGYNAPIVVRDKKYYSYEDPEYTITNIPLTTRDLGTLQEVSQLLSQFKEFSHLAELSELINKLEDKIHSEQTHSPMVIHLEKNELLTGIGWLDGLYKAIVSRTTVSIGYRSFKTLQASEILFYPYLLKEYRNRWFVLGLRKQGKEITTLALDRIQDITARPTEPFSLLKGFDPQTYFADIVGVTRNIGEAAQEIMFLATSLEAPYIRTKPLHDSQKVLEETSAGTIFSIRVIPNYELERELIGFGEGLKVLSPDSLVARIQKRVSLMQEMYTTRTP